MVGRKLNNGPTISTPIKISGVSARNGRNLCAQAITKLTTATAATTSETTLKAMSTLAQPNADFPNAAYSPGSVADEIKLDRETIGSVNAFNTPGVCGR